MNIFSFASKYRKLVLFGFGFTFFSNFGQSFFISLFVPFFLIEFSISNATFGTLYSTATLGSAFLLAWIGPKIDIYPIKTFTFFVFLGLLVSAFLLSVTPWPWLFFLSLLGLRLFGQGLCSLSSHTVMGRYFLTLRGRALSLSSLGYTLGEAILPITMATIIGLYGWRAGWGGVTLFILAAMPLLILYTLRKDPEKLGEQVPDDKSTKNKNLRGTQWRRSLVLRDYRFYLLLPGVTLSPFLLTGFFLYQLEMAAWKGWEMEIMASAFIMFALAKSSFALITGPMVDRFKACRLFPFFLIPFLTAMGVLLVIYHPVAAFIYYFLIGISEGFAANIKTAIYAELYGTANLGSIRSMMSMFMVMSTAVSPILFGTLIDGGISFGTIIYGSIFLILLVMIAGSFIFREAQNTIS
ncbi:MFS transporter [Balneolaceae bacterium ANBcel3]|nr:MFS transporter [Balneolaceae bacterium ANBcel3]